MKVLCASGGYYDYTQIWRPKVNQYSGIRPEKKNIHDPYAMGVYGYLPGKIAEETLVGYVPRQISHFWTFLLNTVPSCQHL